MYRMATTPFHIIMNKRGYTKIVFLIEIHMEYLQ
jgi:hypothetical protein